MICQVQVVAVANVQRQILQRVQAETHHAIYRISRALSRVLNSFAHINQAVIFRDDLEALVGKYLQTYADGHLIRKFQDSWRGNAVKFDGVIRFAREAVRPIDRRQNAAMEQGLAGLQAEAVVERSHLHFIRKQSRKPCLRGNIKVISNRKAEWFPAFFGEQANLETQIYFPDPPAIVRSKRKILHISRRATGAWKERLINRIPVLQAVRGV